MLFSNLTYDVCISNNKFHTISPRSQNKDLQCGTRKAYDYF